MKISKFAVGLISGAILGIMFAPAQGKKSRKTVASAAGKVNHTLRKWFGNDAHDLEQLKTLLADESVTLTDGDRKRLVQLIENNQKVLKELDS